ncbi:unnamed protein product [Closterium sp. Naga37s-1]|nr:unnamed protein product [Closterium sp. Naga37s-1]
MLGSCATPTDSGLLYIGLDACVEPWTCALCNLTCGAALNSAMAHIASELHYTKKLSAAHLPAAKEKYNRWNATAFVALPQERSEASTIEALLSEHSFVDIFRALHPNATFCFLTLAVLAPPLDLWSPHPYYLDPLYHLLWAFRLRSLHLQYPYPLYPNRRALRLQHHHQPPDWTKCTSPPPSRTDSHGFVLGSDGVLAGGSVGGLASGSVGGLAGALVSGSDGGSVCVLACGSVGGLAGSLVGGFVGGSVGGSIGGLADGSVGGSSDARAGGSVGGSVYSHPCVLAGPLARVLVGPSAGLLARVLAGPSAGPSVGKLASAFLSCALAALVGARYCELATGRWCVRNVHDATGGSKGSS